ncbi:MAG: ThiF family adenylyltransferase, partial [Actinomycetes bacterium]
VKNLVLMGIRHITVCDLDRIENSNLARCIFFRESDEGQLKAEVLAKRAMELNPDVRVIPVVGDVRLKLGLGDFIDADLALGGLDNREARMYVNQACWKTSTPFIDGAIEGLMGAVKVFLPPHTACYECTMSERDHELVAARRTCALLSREEMLAGKVPTTATSSSVVAAIQVQEAVKLLHRDRLGDPTLAGAAYNFNGLTHDSYVVQFTQREDCLVHDTYDFEQGEVLPADGPLSAALDKARALLGPDAIVELEQEVLLGASCTECGIDREVLRPVDALSEGDGVCPQCGKEMRLDFTHAVSDGSPLLNRSIIELGLPANDALVARSGMDRVFFRTRPAGASK